MSIVQVKSNTIKIPLGRQGENLARRVQFSLSSWQTEYGAGVPELIHKRPGDNVAYPVTLRLEGAAAYWDVINADTEFAGSGKCELTYYVNGIIAKSITYQTVVEVSMNEEIGYEPQAVPSWVDAVNQAIAEANTATKAAAEAAETANKAAENASLGGGGIPSDAIADDEGVIEMLDEVFGEESMNETNNII